MHNSNQRHIKLFYSYFNLFSILTFITHLLLFLKYDKSIGVYISIIIESWGVPKLQDKKYHSSDKNIIWKQVNQIQKPPNLWSMKWIRKMYAL